MKSETRDALESIIKELEQLKSDVYDYDYDDTVIWNINNALRSLKNNLQ